MVKYFHVLFIGAIIIKAASSEKKDAEFWIQHFQMSAIGPGGPYMSALIPYGNLTENLPSGYPSGQTRKIGSDNLALFKGGNNLFAFYKYPGIDILHHVRGGPLDIYIIDPGTGELTKKTIGARTKDDGFTIVVDPGLYVAWKLRDRKNKPNDFSLVAVTSIPEYRPGDETPLTREFLLSKFPQHKKLIHELAN